MERTENTGGTPVQRDRLHRVRDCVRQMPRHDNGEKDRQGTFVSQAEMIRRAREGNGIRKLDMRTVWEGDRSGCNSKGCVIGLTVSLFPDETEAVLAREKAAGRNDELIDAAAAEVLGLETAIADALFYGSGSASETFGEQSGPQVADAIDRILNGASPQEVWTTAAEDGKR